MPTVADIILFLDSFAPPELAEEWDNTGLLLGEQFLPVNRVMTCLTITPDVVEEAIEQRAHMIVTHHPVLFRAASRITDESPEGLMLLELIRAGTAVFSPHTRFDSAERGINQQLAEAIGLSEITPLIPHAENPRVGTGRIGTVESEITLNELLGRFHKAVSPQALQYTGRPESTVRRVGIACGAAEQFLLQAAAAGCDTFVTGEARFHQSLLARSTGINLILLGHYASERPAVEQLAVLLENQFPDVTVWPSKNEHDPLTVFA